MLIESITIKNFRQFHNEIKLDFSTSKEKNVTVISFRIFIKYLSASGFDSE